MDILFLTYQTYEEFNRTGIDNALVYMSNTTPSSIPIILTAIWFLFALGSYLGTKRATGQADFITSGGIASFVLFAIVMIMRLQFGIVNDYIVGIVIAILAAFIIGMFIPRDRS